MTANNTPRPHLGYKRESQPESWAEYRPDSSINTYLDAPPLETMTTPRKPRFSGALARREERRIRGGAR